MTLCAQTRVHAQAAASNIAASRQAGNEALETGMAAYDAGRLDEALRSFERAHELLKAPRTLFRIGDVADKLGMRARAVSAYQQYLDSVPTTSDRALVEARIRANGGVAPASVAPVVAAPASASASARVPAPVPLPIDETAEVPVVHVQAVAAAAVVSAPAPAIQAAPAAATAAIVLATPSIESAQPAAAPEAATAPLAERKSRVSAWWIVAGVSVIAVGGIVAAAFALSMSSARQPTPIQGNVGGTVQTLGAP